MRRASLCLFAILLASVLVLAQVTLGRIHGFVTDNSSAVLPGVTVTLVSADGTPAKVYTNERGDFSFADVAPGVYTVTFALEGFVTDTQTVVVAQGQTHEMRSALSVSGLEETITVTGSATVVSAQRVANRAGFNTEAYDKIDDHSWADVTTRSLSTFSIDVDTASYSNVRRFLNNGELPPEDAVRIEELINYFTYDYPAPRGRAPFSITTSIDDAPWKAGHRLVLIGLQARRLDLSQTPPRNLVFLIDVSGSMQHVNKLPLVKASLALLARNLRPVDRIAIVVYAGAAGVVLPSTSGENIGAILDALNALDAGGSTNGAQGIQRAYEIAREHFIPGGVNRVVLATDGDFNVGVTNRGDLVRLIEENRESGVMLTTLGYGMGNLKDATLEQLADRGNGNYAYIDSLAEARKVLVEGAAGTLVTVAKDVKLQVEFNPRLVSRYRLIGYENRQLQDRDFIDDTKDAGDMGAGHSVTALYEIVPAKTGKWQPDVEPLRYQMPREMAWAAARDELMTVKVRHKSPEGKKSTQMIVTVADRHRPSPALGFAAAVAEFGMLLRDSPFKGDASYAHARALAEEHLGPNPSEYRREFVRLIDTAARLSDSTLTQ